MATTINADTSDGLKLTADTSGEIELQSAGSTKVTMDTNGNVGIGTGSPVQKLSLNSGYVQVGNGIGGSGGVKYPYSSSNAGTRNWRTRTDITNYGDWGIEQSTTQTGETYASKLIISPNGSVGIGTGGPVAKLDVNSGDIAISSTQASDNGDLGELKFWNTTNAGSGSGTSFVNDVASIQGQMEGTGNNSGGSLHFYTKTDGGSKTQQMTITGSGNVGIGASSPSFEAGAGTGLEIRNASGLGGHLKLTDSASGGGGTNGFDLYAYNTSGYIENYELGGTVFRNGGDETMRMRNGGQLIIGGNAWSGGVTTAGLQIDMNTSTDATFGFIIRNGSNAESFIHKMNGSTFNSTGTFGTISDRRFKENIVDATSKLDEIKQLKVRNFNLIGEEEKYLGFIAQEIEQVFPNIVDTQAERTYKETDDDGNEATVTTPEKKLVKTTVLIPILTKALQEAVTKIEDLETRIEALENA